MDLNGGDTVKIALILSTSNALDPTLVGAIYSSLTHEVAAVNGYTTGGATAATPIIAGGGATATISWSAATVSITASGGSIVCYAALLYDSTSGDLIAFSILDDTLVNTTILNGITLDIALPAIFSLA